MARHVSAAILCSVVLVSSVLIVGATPAGAVSSGVNGRIAFTSDRGGSTQIYSMRPDGTGVIKLTTSAGTNVDPNYSADGSKIAFISTRDGSSELFWMMADGSSQRLVATPGLSPSHPTWAPNGTAIAFAGLAGTDSDIYTIKPDGTGLTDLTPNAASYDGDPSWSPGGAYIAFDRMGTGGSNIWKIQQTGVGLSQVTTSGFDSHPSWSPDNRTLAFQSSRDTQIDAPFASIKQPVGMAWTPSALLETQQKVDAVSAVSPTGAVSTFATLPDTGGADIERYLAVSPGLGGFPAGGVYVSVRQNIYEISPDGSTVTLFATCPDLPNSNNFVVFDRVGTFGFNLIVLGGQRATVYTVNSSGLDCIKVADLSGVTQELEGSDVAPPSFAPYGGDLIAASKFDSTVYAIGPDGSYSVVGSWEGVEQVQFVPSTVCNWADTGRAFFANMGGLHGQSEIFAFPVDPFLPLAGTPTALVTSETNSSIGQFTSNGSSIDISTFFAGPMGNGIGDLEESAFAGNCPPGRALRPRSVGDPTDEIYTVSFLGGIPSRLTTNTADDTRPAWSPDGTTIVFQSDRDDPTQPTCEATQACLYEIYSMHASDGTGQTNLSNDVASADDAPDWETVSFGPITVDNFFFAPQLAFPKQGGTLLWEFLSKHTASDNSGMRLFDSRTKNAGQFFAFTFTAAGQYPVICKIHPTLMTGTIKVPMKAAPVTGTLTTTFTLTWSSTTAATHYDFHVQIKEPGSPVFVDWMPATTQPSATFVADAGTGVYSFQARLEKDDGTSSTYSVPVSITVNP